MIPLLTSLAMTCTQADDFYTSYCVKVICFYQISKARPWRNCLKESVKLLHNNLKISTCPQRVVFSRNIASTMSLRVTCLYTKWWWATQASQHIQSFMNHCYITQLLTSQTLSGSSSVCMVQNWDFFSSTIFLCPPQAILVFDKYAIKN